MHTTQVHASTLQQSQVMVLSYFQRRSSGLDGTSLVPVIYESHLRKQAAWRTVAEAALHGHEV